MVMLIVGIGMFKEWLSDHKRTKSDKQTNQTIHHRVIKVEPFSSSSSGSGSKEESKTSTETFLTATVEDKNGVKTKVEYRS